MQTLQTIKLSATKIARIQQYKETKFYHVSIIQDTDVLEAGEFKTMRGVNSLIAKWAV